MSLSKNDLLAKSARRYRDVPIGDGQSVRIQSLNERERTELELRLYSKDGKVDVKRLPENKLRTLCRCMVDGDGARLFDDTEWQEIEAIDSGIVAKIYSVCLEHIGFEDSEVDDLVGKSD